MREGTWPIMENLTAYAVGYETEALLPRRTNFYQTQILDSKGEFCTAKRITKLFNTCLKEQGTNFDGRTELIRELTGYGNKVPLIFNSHLGAFPTKSYKHKDCIWIFVSQIKDTYPFGKSSEILFKSGHTLLVPTSHRIIRNQKERTTYCMNVYKETYRQDDLHIRSFILEQMELYRILRQFT